MRGCASVKTRSYLQDLVKKPSGFVKMSQHRAS